MVTVLIVFLLLLTFGMLPTTGWHSWGYAPSGIGGLVLVVVLILLLTGRL